MEKRNPNTTGRIQQQLTVLRQERSSMHKQKLVETDKKV